MTVVSYCLVLWVCPSLIFPPFTVLLTNDILCKVQFRSYYSPAVKFLLVLSPKPSESRIESLCWLLKLPTIWSQLTLLGLLSSVLTCLYTIFSVLLKSSELEQFRKAKSSGSKPKLQHFLRIWEALGFQLGTVY